MSDWRDWGYYPPSRPRAAKGGIRAQSQRGAFGQSWWAKRWIGVLESFDMGGRLSRGRSYARNGQVTDIEIASGRVEAKVQGSRPRPYSVSIAMKPLSKAEWRNLAGVVASQAIFGAKLLAGEMPQDIETAFQSIGLSLFPVRRSDLRTDCSCPDDANPCKHIAAVYYLLGEEFDRDPFLIFQLRGMSRDEFLGLLGESPGAAVATEPPPPPEPLPSAPEAFWNAGPITSNLLGLTGPPAAEAALPRRLGSLPFWRGQDNFLDALDRIYAAAAAKTATLIGHDPKAG